MNLTEPLTALRRLGVILMPEGDSLRYRAPNGIITPQLREALLTYKAEILILMSEQPRTQKPSGFAGSPHIAGTGEPEFCLSDNCPPWPPPDATDLGARWEALDYPEIPLSPGVSISNLRKWLYQDWPGQCLLQQVAAIRRFLWEGLPANEVPSADPLLEGWRRVSIPEWQRILQESIAGGDKRREEYARWMLKEILQDRDDKEDQP
jgi:hypothetical protein